jgi:hypothetical protein
LVTTASQDRFDEMRRAWIAAHQGTSTIQRRRAELLGRKVRARQRAIATAVPDPHDDTIIPPLWLRAANSPASQLELLGVLAAAILAALGWIVRSLLKQAVTQLIPGILRAYPIAALLWAGAALGLLIIVLYDPAPTFGQTVFTPWLCAQLAAAFVAAGLYGVAEGWLALPESQQWWPLTPPRRPITAEDASAILGGYDITGSELLDAQPLNEPGERSRP